MPAKVTGAAELSATLRTLGGQLAPVVIDSISPLLAATAQRRAPRRTGRLASSVRPITGATSATSGRGGVPGVAVGGVQVDAPYAGYVHWGTSRQSPQRFVLAAYASTETELARRAEVAVQTVLDRRVR